jgi:hypothetical protein
MSRRASLTYKEGGRDFVRASVMVRPAILTVLAASLTLALATGSARPATRQAGTRCVRVRATVVQRISAGLNTGIHLRAARAVRSHDYSTVWFVAANLQGPGLAAREDIGVWATDRLGTSGLTFSGNAVAREFSDWGPGPGFHLSDDGFIQAESCTRSAIEG